MKSKFEFIPALLCFGLSVALLCSAFDLKLLGGTLVYGDPIYLLLAPVTLFCCGAESAMPFLLPWSRRYLVVSSLAAVWFFVCALSSGHQADGNFLNHYRTFVMSILVFFLNQLILLRYPKYHALLLVMSIIAVSVSTALDMFAFLDIWNSQGFVHVIADPTAFDPSTEGYLGNLNVVGTTAFGGLFYCTLLYLRRQNAYTLLLGIPCLVIIAFSFSRAAYVVTAVLALAICWVANANVRWVMTLIVCTCAALVGSYQSNESTGSAEQLVRAKQETFAQDFVEVRLGDIFLNPISEFLTTGSLGDILFGRTGYALHNYFTHYLINYGILGGILALWLISINYGILKQTNGGSVAFVVLVAYLVSWYGMDFATGLSQNKAQIAYILAAQLGAISAVPRSLPFKRNTA